MESGVTFIGFGEAGMAFAVPDACGYDRKIDAPATRADKLTDFVRHRVHACDSPAEALGQARTVLSLVTADQALAAARANAPLLAPDALWLDMNSVAPETKREAARVLEPNARYVDVAVMSPVHPARFAAPLLVSGPQSSVAERTLRLIGFTDVRIVGDRIGQASSIKMIRSVMVKGLEALSAECVLAAEAAGVRDEVIASLDASWPGADWARRLDYNLDRMMVHGLRRAAEMEEVVRTLDALGTGSEMTRGAVQRQRGIGRLRVPPRQGLSAKLQALLPALARMESAA